MKKISILFVANSFGDDTIMYMSRIAKEFGIELDAHILYIGGCDINTHIKNLINNSPKYEYRLVNEDYDNIITQYDYIANEAINNDWDYIVLQQQSSLAGMKNGLNNLDQLIELIKQINPNKDTKYIWNMTWSYPNGSTHPCFVDFNNDQAIMDKGILDNIIEYIIPNKTFSKIIPVGLGIKQLRNYLPNNIIHRDMFHLSFDVGRFLASLLAIKTIFDVDIDNIKFNPINMDEKVKKEIISCVDFASEEMKNIIKNNLFN